MNRKKNKLPKVGRHSSGQARITLSGKVYYLGPYGSLEAQKKYTELVEKWEANGRQPLEPAKTPPQMRTVRELFAEYEQYIDDSGRYRKRGQPTSQRGIIAVAIREFVDDHGDDLVPTIDKSVIIRHRDELERRPTLTRGGVNKKIAHIRAGLRWAWERGTLSDAQWFGISNIRPLKTDKSERRRKRAVTPEEVEAVAKHLPRVLAAMVRLQMLLGCRPGEVCAIRWQDIDETPVEIDGMKCWTYYVDGAKTEHHGRETSYAVPPAAQAILEGFRTVPAAFIFSPQQTMRDLHDERRAARQTPATQQMRDRDTHAKRKYGARYDDASYRQAVKRACQRANIEPFNPHEIRHGTTTRAAERFGAFAASSFANHSNVQTTEGYLHKKDENKYRIAISLSRESQAAG